MALHYSTDYLAQHGQVERFFRNLRYIISWKLCSTMCAEDVTETLDMALEASGCLSVHVKHKPNQLHR